MRCVECFQIHEICTRTLTTPTQACIAMFYILNCQGSCLQFFDSVFVSQLAAQVLEEFDDEDVGVGLLDGKLDKVIAKKLGKHNEINIADSLTG